MRRGFLTSPRERKKKTPTAAEPTEKRDRSDSHELVVYDPHFSRRLKSLLFGHGVLALLERPPALLSDTVPLLVSYMDSATLLRSSTVCVRWSRLCQRDVYWAAIVRDESRRSVTRRRRDAQPTPDGSRYALDPDEVDPPPKPVKTLWLTMRRAFRSLLAESAPSPGPLPALATPIAVY